MSFTSHFTTNFASSKALKSFFLRFLAAIVVRKLRNIVGEKPYRQRSATAFSDVTSITLKEKVGWWRSEHQKARGMYIIHLLKEHFFNIRFLRALLSSAFYVEAPEDEGAFIVVAPAVKSVRCIALFTIHPERS